MSRKVDYNQLNTFSNTGDDFINAVIEVPMNSFDKIEWDSSNQTMIVDRVNLSDFPQPANYGFIPRALGGDGDNLDILVLSNQSIKTGSVLSVKVLGIMFFIDDKQTDDKIVAVMDGSDTSLLDQRKNDIEFYFNNYKKAEVKSSTEVVGWGDSKQALAVIKEACRSWQDRIT